MPNLHRGEIEARLDGAPFRLCLTLGALAELESAFGDTDMLALAERFQSGRLSARDAQRIIGAGLRGAGNDITDEAVARMQADGGAAGFVDIVARLLAGTFGGAPSAPSTSSLPSRKPGPSPQGEAAAIRDLAPPEGRAPHPFPWDDVMAAGLGLLRLPPPVFWAMTPKELEAALRGLLGPLSPVSPLSRSALAQLMSRFPDSGEWSDGG